MTVAELTIELNEHKFLSKEYIILWIAACLGISYTDALALYAIIKK